MIVHESPVFSLDHIADAIYRAAQAAEMPNRAVVVRGEDGLAWSWSWLMRRFYGPEVATVEILTKYAGAHHVHVVLRDILQLKVKPELDDVCKAFEEANVNCLQIIDVLDTVWEIPREPQEIESFSESLAEVLMTKLPKAIADLDRGLEIAHAAIKGHLALSGFVVSELLTADGEFLGYAEGLENVCDLYDQRD